MRARSRRRSWIGIAAITLGLGLGATTVAAAEIDNFFRVNQQVCTGGQPTPEQLTNLKAQGIRAVINLREAEEYDIAAEAAQARELDLLYVSIPVRTAAPQDEQVAAFLKATAAPNIFPAFIHCGSGNRVGAFWMIRRVLVDGWTAEKAEAEAKQIGLKSPNLREFALGYIHRHEKKTTPSARATFQNLLSVAKEIENPAAAEEESTDDADDTDPRFAALCEAQDSSASSVSSADFLLLLLQ